MSVDANIAKPAQLSWGLRLGWGIGSLGGAALINAVGFLALFYLIRAVGLSPATAGTLVFLAKCFDIITDPLMGVLSDRTRSPWGRRRPWLFVAAFVSPLAFVLLFYVPAGAGMQSVIWAAVALLLYALGYTMFNIPYLAMPAEMTRDYHEQSRLMSMRVVFVALGILVGGALGPFLVSEFGGDAAAYSAMSWVLAAIIGSSMAASFFGTSSAAFTTRSSHYVGLKEQWSQALANRPFIVLLSAKFLHMTGVALAISSLLFMVTVVLQRDEAAASAFVFSSTAGTLLAIPFWLASSRRLGKRNTYLLAVFFYVPVLLSWFLAGTGESWSVYLLRGFGIGVVTGGLTLTAQAMLPDAIQEDSRLTGLQREGVFTAAYSFMEKTAFALGPLVFGLALDQAGFDPADVSGADESVRQVILFSAATAPAIASALSALVLCFYTLDRRRFS
ncbi:MAG: MFS transporter [Gammaproteobacteria bacterium]